LGAAAAGDRVHVPGHVPDADLPALYRGAALVAYLSEDEGFGLPIVEAMRSGTPVLTLDRPVLREVAGTAAHYLAEATPDAIAEALAALLGDAGRREALRAAGLERAARFDWRRTAAETLDVLVRAAGSRH
jgi:glycosyltransferase involved in cell wall biosynthesis